MAVTAELRQDGTFQFHGSAHQITKAKNKALSPFKKQVLDYGAVLRLLPDESQKQAIAQQIGNARFVRNDYLNERIKRYSEKKETLTVSEYKKEYLPKLKEDKEFLKLSDKFALESALENVDAAYKNFFEGRSGFPKYASKWKPNGNKYTTKYTNDNIRLFYGDDRLPYIKLPKMDPIRIALPKNMTIADICPEGTSILKATVTKTSTCTYEVSLGLETVIDQIIPVSNIGVNDVVGIDLGLKHFCTLSDGLETVKLENPRWIKIHAKRLRRLQQSLSRKQYDRETHTGSKNWEKARKKVAAEQKKTADQRKDFHHKVSRLLADSCSVFVCEDLNIKGMMKNRHLSKAIASVGWYGFLMKVKYKMERQGKHFLQVSRWYASSQICTHCGCKNPEVKDLKIRAWECPQCHSHNDRDENAARNIRGEGIRACIEQQIIAA